MLFSEPGAGPLLEKPVAAGRLKASTDPAIVATAEHVIVVIGPPVDEHLNPDQAAITKALSGCAGYLRDGQILILRSTVYPGVTALVEKMAAGLGVEKDVAFCPERIAEGNAMTELFELPQIVSSRTPNGVERASRLFGPQSDLLVIAAPHADYRDLPTNKPVADIWNVLGEGARI
jgi:UDP-N-acetyl-D-mannosaminuronic acid dehydrogenase